jgi:hypothetical protein
MTLNAFRWLATPGCGIAAALLVYDACRALQPRIAGERLWRQTRVLGLLTLLLGTFVLQRLRGPAWLDGVAELILVVALGPLLLSSVWLGRLVAGAVREPLD